MADYIDREEILKEEQIFQQYNSAIKDDEYIRAVTVADIEAMPSADVVEVVKCKNCKHRILDRRQGGWCNRLLMFVSNEDFFCKWGEKE